MIRFKHTLFILFSLLALIIKAQEIKNRTPNLRGNGMAFTPNNGQIVDSKQQLRPDILFKGDGKGMDVYLREGGFSYVLSNIPQLFIEAQSLREKTDRSESLSASEKEKVKNTLIDEKQVIVHRIDVDFLNCNKNTSVNKYDQVEGYTNYFYAHCPNGITNVFSYNLVEVKNMYNKIDVKYFGGKENGLKYDIVVNPGGNVNDIQLKYSGLDEMYVQNGNLYLKTISGEIEENIPKIYQEINNELVEIPGKYILKDKQVSFAVEKYNPNFPLVIDPWITYFGGSGSDQCAAIQIDKLGNVVFTGPTTSANLPVTAGTFQTTYKGNTGSLVNGDAMIAKFSDIGNRLWVTYYGGTKEEFTGAVAIDASNNVLITGTTLVSVDLPMKNPGGGAYQAPFNNGSPGLGNRDIFIAKFNAAGTNLIWATYYGGAGDESATDITSDGSDNIIVVGTSWDSGTFPLLAQYQGSFGGFLSDAFVVKFNGGGVRQWSSLYGGNSIDKCFGVTADNAGDIYICGQANDALPMVAAHQSFYGGGTDGFIAKLTGATGFPAWCTYYGGVNEDKCAAVSVDNLGNVWVGGFSLSSTNIATAGSYQSAWSGWGKDGFVVKFNNAGVRQWASYIGGYNGYDYVTGIANDVNNNVIVTGDTYSSDFPTTSCAYQKTFLGTEDQFICNFDPSGNNICSGLLGIGNSSSENNETSESSGGSVAVNGCYLYLAAWSQCTYPVTAGAFQTSCGGGWDGAISKLSLSTCGGQTTNLALSGNSTSFCQGQSVDYTSTYTSCSGTAGTTYSWSFSGGTPATSTMQNPTGITYNTSGTYDVKLVVQAPCGKDSLIQTAYITVNSCGVLSAGSAKTDVICNGGSTGSATVTALSGTANYTYSWSNGVSSITSSPNHTITSLLANTYTVTITDGAANTATTTVTITQPTALSVSSPTVTNATCGNTNGSLTLAIPTGGTSGYTYLWSNGATTQNISSLAPISYTVTVTDANGCTKTAAATVGNTSGPTITSVPGTNPSCSNGTGTATASATGGTGTLTYTWSNSSSGQTINNLTAGTYTVTVKDANNCSSISTISITIPTPITTTASQNTPATCGNNNGIAVTTAASGGTGSYTYSWSSGATGLTASSLVAGTYILTVTDANSCTSTTSVLINSSPSATINTVNATNVTCNGQNNGAANVSASGGTGALTYSWSNSISGQTITNVPSGTYVVSVTDASGCLMQSNVTITQPTVIATPTINTTTTGCGINAGTASANASGGTGILTYVWSNGFTGVTNTNLAANTYTVTVYDANNCSVTNTATINTNTGPSVTTVNTSTITCNGQNNGTATVNITGGSAPYNYSWSNGQNSISTSNQNAVSNLAANNYSITVTDNNNCTVTTTAIITEPSTIVFAVSTITDAACGTSNGAATASASGGSGSLSYLWSNSATGQTISGVSSGSYIVTVTDANSCASTTSVLINSNPSATINTVNTTHATCNGQNTGSANISASGGTGTLTYSWSNNTSGQTITNVASGTYVVSVTDASGCLMQSNVTITQPTAITTPTVNTTATGCGVSTGTAIATASGGTGILTYVWSNGFTGVTNTNLAANTYTVSVYDANNCSVTNTTTINTNNGPTVTAMNTFNITCNGQNNGIATVNVTGGSSPYTYTWSNGQSSISTSNQSAVSNLAANSYSITITDNSNCSVITAATITEPSAVVFGVPIITNATCATNTGSVSIAAAGGSGTLNYNWSNSASGQTLTNVGAGTYTVTVSDANFCTTATTVLINNSPSPVINSIAINNVNCNGQNNGSAVANVSGGIGTLTYSWSNASTGSTASGLAVGNYIISVTDASGCLTQSTVSITEPSVISFAAPTITNAACGVSDGSASVTAIGGTGSMNYTWNNSASGQTITNIGAGTYVVTVTDANTCTNTTSILINNTPSATINSINKTNITCNGSIDGSAIVNASAGTGALTYSWNNGVSGATITNVTSGTYIISVTDGSGCLTQSSVIITQPTSVSAANSNANSSTCGINNGSANIIATGGTGTNYTYSWSTGYSSNGSGQSAINNLAPNTYSVTVTDQNNCSYTHTFVIGNKPSPIFTGSSPIITPVDCKGNNSGQIDVLISSGSAPYTYSWSTGQSTTTISQQSTINNLLAGNYTITITDKNGCVVDTSIVLIEPAFVLTSTVTATNATCATGGSATVNISGGNTGNYTYSWSNGTNSVSNSQLAVGNNLSAGNYTITVVDTKGCTTISTTTINVPAPPTVTATQQTAATCNSSNGVAIATGSGGSGSNYTYTWSNNATGITANNLSANNYTVTVTDGNGCATTSTVVITNNNGPSVSSQSSTGTCVGQATGQVAVVVAGGSGPYTYSWSNGVTSTTTNLTSQISNLTSGTYTLTITDANNCTATATALLPLFPNPTANAGTDQTITNGTSIQLIASGGTSYLWTPSATLTNAGISNPIANPTQTTTYTVTVTDANNCSSTDDITVTVTLPQTCNASEADEFVANIFTPNGDGRNDILRVQGYGLTDIYFAIYNRWGQKLFETTDQTKGWDGTQNGKPIDEQTVVYYLKATCITTGENIVKKGDISVVR